MQTIKKSRKFMGWSASALMVVLGGAGCGSSPVSEAPVADKAKEEEYRRQQAASDNKRPGSTSSAEAYRKQQQESEQRTAR